MTDTPVLHSTFVIQRTYPVGPERVFQAFADPAKKRAWYGDRGREAKEFRMDFRVGGFDRMLSLMGKDTPFPGTALVTETTYQDIVPDERIVFAYTMTLGDRKISASLVTIELKPSADGTDFVFTEQAAFFEGADGPEMRETGQRFLLDLLGKELAL
jgi:uncharacterized protein YndB with AHSA1/START domain